MAIQFGYLTLFAVAFPAAPIAALINNMIESRSDLVKLMKSMQRPHPREAANIGTWVEILEVMSYIACMVNCAIIVFTSKELAHLSLFSRLWIGLVIEHLLFFLKFTIAKFIPDAPAWVREAYAKRTYYKQLTIDQAIQVRKEVKRQSRAVNNQSVQIVVDSQDPLVRLED